MRYTAGLARILRVLTYRRVSTREQGLDGTSLEAQRIEIQRYCKAHELPDPVDYVEVESGGEESEEKRGEVQRLLNGVRAGDAVVVSKIDRFGRDMVFIVKHVRAIRKKGACFISIAEAFDSRRPESEMMLGAWAMAADMERRRIQERTQGPRKLLREQGFFVEGTVPFGYVLPKDGTRRLVIVPEDASIVREMFGLAANGRVSSPGGGFLLWVELPAEGADAMALYESALRRGSPSPPASSSRRPVASPARGKEVQTLFSFSRNFDPPASVDRIAVLRSRELE